MGRGIRCPPWDSPPADSRPRALPPPHCSRHRRRIYRPPHPPQSRLASRSRPPPWQPTPPRGPPPRALPPPLGQGHGQEISPPPHPPQPRLGSRSRPPP